MGRNRARSPRWPMLVTLVAIVLAAMSGLAGAQPPTPSTPAFARLASCISGRQSVAIVLLMDESGSLKETDPDNSRVSAAIAALNGLQGLVERSNSKVRVDLQVAGFGPDFEASAPWVQLDSSSAPQIRSRIEGFASRNKAIDTDYANALQGAQASLQARGAAMSGSQDEPPCTAVMWFTDGKFDVEDRLTARAREAGKDRHGISQFKEYAPDTDLFLPGGGAKAIEWGRKVLCDPGGIADQYRTNQTFLFAVALNSALRPEDQAYLQSVVSGGGCGNLDGTNTGGLLAGDLGQLVGLFDQVVTSLGNPSAAEDVTLNACPKEMESCPQGTKTFDVDGALRRFHVLAQVDGPGIAVRLVAPGAAPVDIPVSGSAQRSGTATVGDSPVSWSWLSTSALAIDAESSPSAVNWAGTWTITFIDTTGVNPGVPIRAKIYLFGDIVPRTPDDLTFRAGETTEFTVELARAEGTPIPPTSFSGDVTVNATVTDPATNESVDLGSLERGADGIWVGSYRAPEQISSSSVNLGLTAAVTTRSGIALAPAIATVPVTVLPPVGFPTMLTRHLAVGPVTGTEPATATIKVLGSERSDTCVWLDDVRFASGLTHTKDLDFEVVGAGADEANCLKVKRDSDAELELKVVPTASMRARASGELVLSTKSMNANRSRPATVRFDVQLVKPASAGVAWAIFLGLVAFGIGVPLLAFYLANFVVARFAPLGLVEGCSVRLEVSSHDVRRIDGAPGPIVRSEDFRAVGGSTARVREFVFADVEFRARVSRNPFRPPYGVGRSQSHLTVGSARRSGAVDGGRVALWITKEWVFVLDDANDPDDPVEGRLVAFVVAMDRYSTIESVERSLRDRLPALAEHLHAIRRIRSAEGVPVGVGDGSLGGSLVDVVDGHSDPRGTGSGVVDWGGRQVPGSAPETPAPDATGAQTNSGIWED